MRVLPSALAAALALSFAAQAKDLPLGMSTYQITQPMGTANMQKPMTWNIPIQDPTDKSKTKVVPVPVTNIPVWNPATETAVTASARKAGAIKDAIDAAVMAGTLPNDVVTTVTQAMVPVLRRDLLGRPVRNMFGQPIIDLVPGYSLIKIVGVTKTVTVANGDPTKEVGGGGNWQALPPQPTPMTKPSMSGSGSSSGYSTGLDPSGFQSVVGFGFWDPTGANSTLDIAALFPVAGETDGQVLSDLATLFDTDFGSAGYTASYNAATDTLSLDQTIPGTDLMWFGDSDTRLDLTGDNVPVPVSEPSTLLLFGSALLTLGLLRRNILA